MAPKRRHPPPSTTAKRAPIPRPSRLAKEHGATAAQEAEIKEAYLLFAVADPDASTASGKRKANDVDGTVIRTGDVRRCLIALNAPSSREEMAEILETLDPEGVGVVGYEHFFAVGVMKVQSRGEEGEDEDDEGNAYEDEGEEEDVVARGKGRAKGKGRQGRAEAEIETAFKLFTRDESEQITLAHLRRVAKELREDIDDKTLKDMIREANGGGKAGVGKEEFGDVMRRAGVFG
ncbi:hypothetical protein KVT40_000361 [Elsinoe batatas]|uniref:Calmodulin n=1 Tax=Elsinoe batatas TaxID=2601811 RepID=A0A8K0LB88_9PEZI|nr:hypothetical protein KVT40_000361 [Elsinoe batatas]